ncbi:ATP synthase F1 subunit epsilon [Verrucomicrobiaceae bacterium R5-34]|uniref:ATP synthase epsilon chain n=1 Tax=Oceaniferula flava TaxID=2800421 RepID=A0AAE2SC01_9BACT|nr:ATP synthase F1 subunit epsilon [Oceaniferula flavus]MBK1831226.1 ATP synthase F1 subunit epsilon [Verrucomicrobiaceae bacterium R5-34]MBK1855395.1 ATP synthase F1 subunit epsilon [Oceaniferula flavus]MBM1136701.1 ATP synthase F1 subunit epsilon [Oceaniferula flavus]
MLHLDIVTPEKKIFSDTVQNVYLPSSEGEMGVLELHAALVTPLEPGELRYLKDGKEEVLAVGEGFVEVTQEKVIVLCDLALAGEDIDEAAVEKAMERAKEALENAEHEADVDIAALQAMIAKSTAQLKVKRRNRH